MIKAIMLIFSPASVWDRIALDKDNFKKLLFVFLIPLILISVGVQMASLMYLDHHAMDPTAVRFDTRMACIRGASQAGIYLALVLLCSQCVKSVAKTFHRRNTFEQGFCVAAHGLAPFFLMSMLDAIPGMSPLATFGIAISLSLGTLYYGIPRVMEPDPPSAFGIYFSSCLMMLGITGLARLLVAVVIAGGKLHYAP
jgi:hypothetical protein